jgi:hypothetical protein
MADNFWQRRRSTASGLCEIGVIILCLHVPSRAHLGMQRPIALCWLNEMVNRIKDLQLKVEQ